MRLTSSTLLSGLAAFGLFGSFVAAADEDSKAPKETYFDSLPVPPLVELTPKNFEEVANQTKWLLVKHYRYNTTASPPSRIAAIYELESLANLLQPLLPPLPGVRPDIPDCIRVLLHI